MNRNEFNRFIAGSALPGPGDLEGIKELITLFPWFHSAQMVLLRGLKENSDIRFDTQLKDSALYVSDREVLYHYLFMHPTEPLLAPGENKEPVQQQEEEQEEAPQFLSTPDEVLQSEPAAEEVFMEETVREEVSDGEVAPGEIPGPETLPEEGSQREATAEEIPAAEAVPSPETTVEEAVVQQQEKDGQTAPVPEMTVRTREELIAEIEARLEELASMTDNVTEKEVLVSRESEEPVINTEEEHKAEKEEVMEFIPDREYEREEPPKQMSQADLIDRFIMTNPTIERLSPSENRLVRDLSESSAQEKGSFITETLAKIYVNQGYYTKAINIYEKLSLQYPEKSAYFADRIEKIRELIK
jgi:hypothetical protein